MQDNQDNPTQPPTNSEAQVIDATIDGRMFDAPKAIEALRTAAKLLVSQSKTRKGTTCRMTLIVSEPVLQAVMIEVGLAPQDAAATLQACRMGGHLTWTIGSTDAGFRIVQRVGLMAEGKAD